MLIYLRHGDDHGNDVYRHDRRLTDRGRKKAGKLAKRLIEKYGHPDTLFVSPFRRTVETLEAMTALFDHDVDVHRDRRIAQYLSEKQQRDPSISPETAAQIVIVEDRDAFHSRVHDHVEDAQRRTHTGALIWGITHQVVIEEIAGHFDMKISGDLDFLDYVVMLG